ncbi:hypothetical protein G7070_06475 [Propioniciclava coleopterorum]|uniref:Uncharacterized protein n=1 Tax=Propioniciclava coleopterorum TaxID=2714937 RepID=A0A6G7Y5B4_9ACTN|nr:hypothetical protein [Propioniciclava coleopterorum]QIK71973.1 hypothetical protein G7070_06475 [Propioniciclava coleopterorum]
MRRPARPDDDGTYADMDAFAEPDPAQPDADAPADPEPAPADPEPAPSEHAAPGRAPSAAEPQDPEADAPEIEPVVTEDTDGPAAGTDTADATAEPDAEPDAPQPASSELGEDPVPLGEDDPPALVRRAPRAAAVEKGAGRKAPKLLFLAIGVAIGLGVAWSVNGLAPAPTAAAGMPSNHPDISGATASPAPAALDEAKVAEWTKQAEANPADPAPLRALADEYGRVKDFGEAAVWLRKLLDLNPADTDQRLILGVALYNDNQLEAAEAEWLTVAEQIPTSPDPWYNLGFLYLSQDPPNDAKAEAAWNKVLELAPNTELAAAVTRHLQSLNTQLPVNVTPAPSPTPSK